MQEDDTRLLKRKVKSGTIDVHPTEKALIINYEVEAVISENGQHVISDKKEHQKVIRLKNLTPDSDCTSLAEDIINKCCLIHPSKMSDVEHLITYLKNRKEEKNITVNFSNGEKASIFKLENYVELLYEDMFEKIKGASLILDIAKDPVNLDELSKNESLLSALSRVLREDCKKSLDLSVSIVHVFLCFSTYRIFHSVIAQYKIGSLCMEIAQHELKRYCEIKNEFNQNFSHIKSNSGPVLSKLPLPRSLKSATDSKLKSNIPRSGIPRSSSTDKKGSVQLCKPGAMSNKGSTESLAYASYPINKNTPVVDNDRYEQKKKNLEKILKKQNYLLQLCFTLLSNIAENEKIEDKIRKRNVVELLTSSLEADSVQLLIVVISFLKKLSVYRENKDQMMNLNIIEKLSKLLTLKDTKLDNVTFQLLYNLSFDVKCREKMVKINILQDLIQLLDNGMISNEKYILGILYHLSMDDNVKSVFGNIGSISLFNRMMSGGSNNNMLLSAICLNIALNSHCAQEVIKKTKYIKVLMKQAFENNDIVFIKIARNISMHNGVKYGFLEYSAALLQSIVECDKEDFVLECIGLLGNLSVSDVDFYQLLQTFDIIPFIQTCLVSDTTPDDLILEVLVLLGTTVYDENCAEFFHQAGVLVMLIDLLKVKQEDDELVLQIIYIFYQVLQHPCTREYLIKCTDAPAYFIDLMHDNNPNIRKVCHMCLETIKEFDESWTDRIKLEKFQWHNSHWLEMIQNQILDKSASSGFDDDFPQYNLVQHSSVFNLGSHMSLNVDSTPTSILHSPDSSRCISRYDSETDDFDVEMHVRRKSLEKQDHLKNALKNLVITNDIECNEHQCYNIISSQDSTSA